MIENFLAENERMLFMKQFFDEYGETIFFFLISLAVVTAYKQVVAISLV